MIKLEEELDFDEWLESIRFVDGDGEVLPVELEDEDDFGED